MKLLRLVARRFATARVSGVGPINNVLRELYLSGKPTKQRLGQPRIVVVATGGGGHVVSEMLSEPGASSCLLEAIVPYSKNSTLDFLHKRGQSADDIGFCSGEMALRSCPTRLLLPACVGSCCIFPCYPSPTSFLSRLATSARDRAMELEVALTFPLLLAQLLLSFSKTNMLLCRRNSRDGPMCTGLAARQPLFRTLRGRAITDVTRQLSTRKVFRAPLNPSQLF